MVWEVERIVARDWLCDLAVARFNAGFQEHLFTRWGLQLDRGFSCTGHHDGED